MTSSTTGKLLAIGGAVMQIGPLIGMVGTMIAMRKAFEDLGSSGTANTTQLSAAIGEALIATAIGFGIAIIGVIPIAISLLVARYRAEWFFWFLMIFSIINLLMFPIGTTIGVACLIYCIPKRREFWEKLPNQQPSIG